MEKVWNNINVKINGVRAANRVVLLESLSVAIDHKVIDSDNYRFFETIE